MIGRAGRWMATSRRLLGVVGRWLVSSVSFGEFRDYGNGEKRVSK